MSRGHQKLRKRELTPDRKFGSRLIAKFINYLMQRGKKSVAEKVVYAALEKSAKKLNVEPLEVLDRVLKNVAPLLEVKAKRIGGANYQVPIEVNRERKETLALRWVIAAAKARRGVPMAEKLSLEIIDACNNTGAAIKKKEDTHRMAEANKAFAHFARL
ncbi:30S ribosomal protein S7 [Candidatus Berkelbacteria bacterium CG_4_9_14_0_2_um_filter_42_30]|uniref:Small ribosomal subunit protein uS7 n=6 Tax=Candidatus Berkelbacteria TaxID=1618330 RepID=A0A2M7K2B3_9BACT|nr:MAG: 30S ribosomal protein S7 [Candidatus Berkelbacteria bacterium CG1_02_42_45]PIP50973.1 MAG: 30S ribosomal protein S7 [Candidatus Berkelbacteria bacterium CG23_combo_of_CG06-09_8_20_14_all_41_73]PIR27233.1 MAG: 30S ribosomal protein S7 [Candidatus Berkelbacteria bacterium CG11_big_fil_rev_8_21_14_0_20_42_15]PIX30341.1 MAG: 30S ribosomal protein S7 [Candidatus Berkelbacteria bacterium CG_4_8_14_3_um_filter_42_13]PIZ27480.1 MAG: 30S ribosomal protein S7 [Candidatus Berkelbacteria bacterium 